jgi:hypothetical protein
MSCHDRNILHRDLTVRAAESTREEISFAASFSVDDRCSFAPRAVPAFAIVVAAWRGEQRSIADGSDAVPRGARPQRRMRRRLAASAGAGAGPPRVVWMAGPC